MKEKSYSQKITCGHCYNLAPMEIMGSADCTEFEYEEDGSGSHRGYIYKVLQCPKCYKETIIKNYYDDYMDLESENDVNYIFLFPQGTNKPLGLPSEIDKLYDSSMQIKSIDAGIYAITLRKILELSCVEKKAEGRTLADKITHLSKKGELPANLIGVAKGLKEFGNIGAHDGVGSLSNQEIEIAEVLCRAILEYLYSAPRLAKIAEDKLKKIKDVKDRN